MGDRLIPFLVIKNPGLPYLQARKKSLIGLDMIFFTEFFLDGCRLLLTIDNKVTGGQAEPLNAVPSWWQPDASLIYPLRYFSRGFVFVFPGLRTGKAFREDLLTAGSVCPRGFTVSTILKVVFLSIVSVGIRAIYLPGRV